MATNKGNDSLLHSKTEGTTTAFASLAKSFLGAYNEFSERLEESGILDRLLTREVSADNTEYNCLITCGISGVGTSTLIARLFSKLSTEEFWLTI